MTRSESRTRKPLGLLLCVLILASSVAAPLLERGGFFTHAAVESEHDPATCAHPHDHRICTQVGANLPLAAETQGHHVAHAPQVTVSIIDTRSSSALPLVEGPPSRAPPLA